MKAFDYYIKESESVLNRDIQTIEDEMYGYFSDQFIGEFDTKDGKIVPSQTNYGKANKVSKAFDDTFKWLMLPILIGLGNQLMKAVLESYNYFDLYGDTGSASDFELFKKSIGANVTEGVAGGSFLYNLGFMAEVRQDFQNFILNAITSGMSINDLMRGTRTFFKSNPKSISEIQKYFRKYMGDSFNRMLNSANNYFAKKFGYDSFIYEGGLVEKSRAFCIERNGNTYTREEGESWNDLDWNGKIEGEDFFLQIGGYACRHHLTFIKE